MTRQFGPKLLFLILATPMVWRAAWRAARAVRSLPLDEATRSLVRVPRWSTAYLQRPTWLAGAVDRWLVLLPPRDYGACMRRSLALLDLWARCGLDPHLHLGMARSGDQRHFHAWVEANGIRAGAGSHWYEIWSAAPGAGIGDEGPGMEPGNAHRESLPGPSDKDVRG